MHAVALGWAGYHNAAGKFRAFVCDSLADGFTEGRGLGWEARTHLAYFLCCVFHYVIACGIGAGDRGERVCGEWGSGDSGCCCGDG